MIPPTKGILFNPIQFLEFRSTPFYLCSVSNEHFCSLQSVILTQRVHPFPFRTRKLSSAVATILVWRRTGKIAHCQHNATLRVERGVMACRNPLKNFTRKSVKNSLPVFQLAHVGSPTELRRNMCKPIFLLSSVGRAHDC